MRVEFTTLVLAIVRALDFVTLMTVTLTTLRLYCARFGFQDFVTITCVLLAHKPVSGAWLTGIYVIMSSWI